MLALYCALIGTYSSCLAESEDGRVEEGLFYDSGVPASLSGTSPFGDTAQTVRFTPPRSPWNLTKILIAGWNGFDGETLPPEKLIYFEIRDKDLGLLYQFSDSQIPYFSYAEIVLATFEIPPITVNDDFFVCFYDRGAVGVAYNITEIDNGRSYLYNRYTGELLPARAEVNESKELVPLSWIIRAVGY